MKFFFKFLIIFYTIFTSNLYSSTSEIPNEKVFDNPKKEVTTVEAKKNKEHAEMNIKVNKLSIQEIKGYNIGDGKTQYFIPKEEKENKLLKNLTNNTENQYLIFETKEQLSDYLNKNKKAKKKRDIVNPIQYEVMQDENQTMLTVNSNNDVYILDNKNNIYFGKVLNNSRATKFAAQLLFKYIDIKYLRHHFPNSKVKISTLKSKPLAKIFADGYFENGNNSEFWLNNGYKSNQVTIDRGVSSIVYTLGVSSGLTTEEKINGLEYVSGTSSPINQLAVVLNKVNNYRSIGSVVDLENSKVNFYDITNYSTYDITTSIYMRGNWTGSSSVMAPGHKIKFTPKNLNFIQISNQYTNITVNKLERQDIFYYGNNNESLTDSSATLSPNISYSATTMYGSGNYISTGSFNLFKELQSNGATFRLSMDTSIVEIQPINGNWIYPKIKVKKQFFEKDQTVTGYLYVILPWGEYCIREYNILLKQNVDYIGGHTVNIDSRLLLSRFIKIGENIFVDGMSSHATKDINNWDHSQNYKGLTSIDNNDLKPPVSLNPATVVSVEERPKKRSLGKGWSLFTLENSDKSSTIVADGLTMSLYPMGAMIVNINNYLMGENEDNIIFLSYDSKANYQKLHINENYVYKGIHHGTGELNLSVAKMNEKCSWTLYNAGRTGKINSYTNRNIYIQLNNSKFFDLNALPGTYANETGNSVTKLELYDAENKLISLSNENQLKVQSEFNSFEISYNMLNIAKLKYSTTPITYKLVAYCQDIMLGSLTLTITNSKEENLSDKKFIIDNRLANYVKNNHILNTNGELFKISGEELQRIGNYRDFLKITGTIGSQDNVRISDVRDLTRNNISNIGDYKKYYSDLASTDISVFPRWDKTPLNISSLDSKLAIYLKNNSINSKNQYQIKDEADNLYNLLVDEEYQNGYFEGIGTVNLSNITEAETISWNSDNAGKAGTLNGNNSKAILNISQGNFFNTKSLFYNTNLVTKINVKKNGEPIISGNSLEVDTIDNIIGIDSAGVFYIKKKQGSTASSNKYDIEIFHNDICLGKLILTVIHKNNSSVIIEGIDEFNFSALLPGSSQTLNGQFTISSSSQTVSRVDIPTSANMIKEGGDNNTIPLTITSSTQKEGNNVKGNISVTANVPKETTAGTYSGTIDLTVTIE